MEYKAILLAINVKVKDIGYQKNTRNKMGSWSKIGRNKKKFKMLSIETGTRT